MYSGAIDKRVSVMKRQRVSDGRGGWTTKDVDIGHYWAGVFPVSATEQIKYQALDKEVHLKIFMRYNTMINDDCIIEYRNKRYRIVGMLNPATSDEYMEVVVSEV